MELNSRANTDPSHNPKFAAEGKCSCGSCRSSKNQVFPQSMAKGDYNSNYNDNYRKMETITPNKVTRYDLINKNYIFPQDNYAPESNYNGSYRNTSENRVRTEKISYPDNDLFPKGKFQGNSSYLASYLNEGGGKRQPLKHEGELKVGGKFQGQSNYNENYIGQGVGKRSEKVTFPDNKIMPEGKFQNSSTYTGNYVNNPIQYNPKIKPEGELKVGGGNFNGQSSYLADFSNKEKPTRSQRAKIPINEVMPKGRFEGDSTYGSNYIGNQVEKRGQIKPEGQLKIGGKFQGASSYNNDFEQRGGTSKREKIVMKDNQIMPVGNFEGLSSYSGSYQPGSGSASKMIKQEQQLKVGGQFYGQSSYANNYYDKGLNSKPQRHYAHNDNKILPEGKFQDNTTYGGNYIQNPIQKNLAIRPEGQLKVGGQHFEGQSNYESEFALKERQARAEKIVHPQNDVMPKGKFIGNSTYGDNYIPSTIEKHQQIRPQANIKVGGSKFQGNSTYTGDYDSMSPPKYLNKQSEYIRY